MHNIKNSSPKESPILKGNSKKRRRIVKEWSDESESDGRECEQSDGRECEQSNGREGEQSDSENVSPSIGSSSNTLNSRSSISNVESTSSSGLTLDDLHTMFLSIQKKCESLEEKNKELQEKNVDLENTRKKKYQASNATKRLVRTQVNILLGEDEDNKWSFADNERGPFSPANADFSNKLVDTVRGLIPSTDKEEIKDAVHINYQSKLDTRKKKMRVGDNFDEVMARKSRKDYKIQKRRTALIELPSTVMDAESKNCWKSLVTKEMVSSEEEDMHGEEKIFSRVRKQNRPTKISDFFGELDTFANKRMSKKGKFRSMRRVVGEPKP